VLLEASRNNSDKKDKEKALKLYNEATTFENLFLTFILSDLLNLCSKFSKLFQNENDYLYIINDTIQDLIKYLEDAYLRDEENIGGIYYIDFLKFLEQMRQGNHGIYQKHDSAFRK